MTQPQQLGHKDAGLFRQVVRHFEAKQYKKGLKVAEQILRKNPHHADTQAMKALILSSSGQQKEAFGLAKTALNNNMKSHVCWHVYGILYRTDKQYDESIKAYKFALRLDPDSQPIQRDLANLQIHMRDYQGYIHSRRNMLQQKPGFRQNWTALAIAHHLAGNHEDAENVLTTYEDTLKNKNKPSRTDIEHWEAVLYQNTIIAESGELERAFDHLEAVGKNSPDVLGVMELRADYLLRLKRHSDAEAAYSALIERNPENSDYYDGWSKAKELDGKEGLLTKQAYDTWVEKFPRADAPRRRPLDFLEGDEFQEAADSYLQRLLRKGVPSLFSNIKQLYGDPMKKNIIEKLVNGYRHGSLSSQANGSADKKEIEKSSQFEESVFYFLAQHFNYRPSRNLTEALVCIDRVIELAPESVDAHMTKARTFKYMGNVSKAAEIMDKARSLDTRDRSINSKCAKYQLRNDENDKALETMSKFTRNETAGGPLGDLHDMQCVWYITEDGKSYLRQRKLGLALKRFVAALNIFDGWYEDQFDFHHFSLRKGMIRAYIDMVRWQDHLRDHPFFSRMALSAIEAYLLLEKHPELAHGPLINSVNGVGSDKGADAAERKKAIKKAKKEQQKLEKAEAEKKEALRTSKGNTKNQDGDLKKEDADPLGKTLLETKEPLQEAMKFLGPLLEFNPGHIEAQLAGVEVYLRRKRCLLALKCLSAAKTLDPSHPALHWHIFRFRKTVENIPDTVPSFVKDLIIKEAESLSSLHQKASDWNDTFLNENKTSTSHVQAALRVRQELDPSSRQQNEKDLETTLSSKETTLEQAVIGLRLLEEWASDRAVRNDYSTAARKTWPEATAFQTS